MNGSLPFLLPVPTRGTACLYPGPGPASGQPPADPGVTPGPHSLLSSLWGLRLGGRGAAQAPAAAPGALHCSKPEMTMHFDLLLPGQPLALGEGGGPARRGRRSEEEEAWEAHVTTVTWRSP